MGYYPTSVLGASIGLYIVAPATPPGRRIRYQEKRQLADRRLFFLFKPHPANHNRNASVATGATDRQDKSDNYHDRPNCTAGGVPRQWAIHFSLPGSSVWKN